MSFFGEPIALHGRLEIEGVAANSAAIEDLCPTAADKLFIEKLRARDVIAFDRLVHERTGEIYALLYRLTDDAEDARDLTQETFMRAFQNIERFRGEASLRTWLYRIAINLARNRWRWWRRKKRDKTVSLETPLASDDETPLWSRLSSDANTPEEDLLAHERQVALQSALTDLSQPFREAVLLRDIEGLTYEEIAAALDVNLGTVKSRIARGRNELKNRLSELFSRR